MFYKNNLCDCRFFFEILFISNLQCVTKFIFIKHYSSLQLVIKNVA